jgi:hypothetical protein
MSSTRKANKKNIKNNLDENIENENIENENIENEDVSIEEIQSQQDKELEKCETITDKGFRISYNIIIYCCDFTYKTFRFVISISGIYLLWICLHYVSSHLYVKLCVPNTLWGFIMSPFMTATPHCVGLRWIVYNAAQMINNMWVFLGTWICSTLLVINNNKATETRST